jgi:hypothetical protein
MSTSHGFFKRGGITLHLNFFAKINLVVIRDSWPSDPLRSSRRFIMWHILYRRLLLLLMIDNRFLKNRLLFFINFLHQGTKKKHCSHSHRRIYNGFYNDIALYYGCNSRRYRENSSVTIRVGMYTRFSSSRIFCGTVLLLITPSSRKTTCLVSTILVYLSWQ